MTNEQLITGDQQDRRVYIGGEELLPDLSQRVYNHSPDGFNWGYGGSGPAQLALALLMHFEAETFARMYYQQFKWDVLAGLPPRFTLPVQTVVDWINNPRGK